MTIVAVMLDIKSSFFLHKIESAIGEEAGKKALEKAFRYLDSRDSDGKGTVVAFDLEDIEFATTSFVKSSLLALYQSGRFSTETATMSPADAFGIPTYNVFPMIANANEELEALTDEIFGRRGFPFLSVNLDELGHPTEGRMLGFLDEALLRTMRNWRDSSQAVTAAELRSQFPEEKISQTAWSNRLNDLWRLRLLQRERRGKSWLYNLVIEGINYG